MADVRISEAAPLNEPLVKPRKDAEPARTSDPDSLSWLWLLFLQVWLPFTLTIFSASSGVVIYHSWDDAWIVASVATTFFILVAQLYTQQLFERTPRSSPRRVYARYGVCVLNGMVAAMFSYRVAAPMPSPVATIVWAMVGLYMSFVCRGKVEAQEKTNTGESSVQSGPVDS